MNQKHRTLSFLVGFFCIAATFTLLGCHDDYTGYTGNYPELFSVAIESLPDARGYIDGEIKHEPVLCLIEEDDYGRKMFCYMDTNYNDGKYDVPIYLLICQARKDDYAYYYADRNLVRSYVSDYPRRVKLAARGHTSWIDDPLIDFSNSQITELKEQNDWEQDLNLDKCSKVKIVRKK